MIPVTRTLIADETTLVNNVWNDLDVTPYVESGNTAGVMLEVVNGTDTTPDWGVRKNGSGDDIKDPFDLTVHNYVAIGIDSNNIFECYISVGVDEHISFYIVAYIKNDEGSFFTNVIDKSFAALDSWVDIDISGDTGDETALCAFFLVNAGWGFGWGLRKNGSSDDRWAWSAAERLMGAMMSVDENEILEGYQEDPALPIKRKIYLVGYLTANFTSWANAKNYSTGITGSWEDVDMGSDIPADNNGAMMHFYPSDRHNWYFGGIRKNGTSIDNYLYPLRHGYLWVEIDSERVAEQKIENTGLDLYLWGYTSGEAKEEEQEVFGGFIG